MERLAVKWRSAQRASFGTESIVQHVRGGRVARESARGGSRHAAMHDNRDTCCSAPALQFSMHHVHGGVAPVPYRVWCAACFFTFMNYISANETLMPRLIRPLHITACQYLYTSLAPISAATPPSKVITFRYARRHCQSQAPLHLRTN